MPACEKIRRKSRKICIGDMRDMIQVQTRTIKSPVDGAFDFTEEFNDSLDIWALVETQSGVEVFDGANIKGVVTHLFYIRFMEGFTFEKWITFKGQKFNIIDVQNLEERDEFYLLRCSLRGDEDLLVNFSS